MRIVARNQTKSFPKRDLMRLFAVFAEWPSELISDTANRSDALPAFT
jgi:hypothetical protein